MIPADNYNYTKNITKENISFFKNKVKEKIKKDTSTVIRVSPNNEDWINTKRIVLQIYDFLKENIKDVRIFFTGDKAFDLWCYLNKNQDKKFLESLLKEKFRNSKKHKMEFIPKVIPYDINKNTGLAYSEVTEKDLLKFKRKDSTIDKVYKKIFKKEFPWKKESVKRVIALSQPLVSRPPYKGDQIQDKLEWLKKQKNEKFVKEVSSFIDKLEAILVKK